MQIKLYLKRHNLKEKVIELPNEEQQLYAVKFMLEKEMRYVIKRLKDLEKKGVINNVSIPGKRKAQDLVKSRTSIRKALELIRNT